MLQGTPDRDSDLRSTAGGMVNQCKVSEEVFGRDIHYVTLSIHFQVLMIQTPSNDMRLPSAPDASSGPDSSLFDVEVSLSPRSKMTLIETFCISHPRHSKRSGKGSGA